MVNINLGNLHGELSKKRQNVQTMARRTCSIYRQEQRSRENTKLPTRQTRRNYLQNMGHHIGKSDNPIREPSYQRNIHRVQNKKIRYRYTHHYTKPTTKRILQSAPSCRHIQSIWFYRQEHPMCHHLWKGNHGDSFRKYVRGIWGTDYAENYKVPSEHYNTTIKGYSKGVL